METILDILSSFLLQTNGWEMIQPANCFPEHCFCETIRIGWIRQPANTYSSLSFCLVALFLILSKPKADTNEISFFDHKGFVLLYALSLVWIGLGSMIYHASLSRIGQFLDVTGMNLYAVFILIFHLYQRYRFNFIRFFYYYLFLNLAAAILIWVYPETRRYLFAVILILSLIPIFVSSSKSHFHIKWVFFAIFTLILAFLLWYLDLKKILCSGDSLWQGHAIWHILGAFASYLIYLYYISEKTISHQTNN